jgi:hypothetical protein
VSLLSSFSAGTVLTGQENDQGDAMFRRFFLAGTALALVAVLAIPASAAPAQLSAKLTGAQEVPGPGDPNGKGEAFVTPRPAKRKVCFSLTWKRIEPPTAGHIHKGVEGVAGPVRVTLFEDSQGLPVPGSVDGCVKRVKRKLVRRIKRHPERFYVNLHNDEYPDGAIRGQLGPAL